MAGETRKLKVLLSPAAAVALNEIWQWNAQNHGSAYADRYIAFVMGETKKLETAFFPGKAIPTSPRFYYVIIRRRRTGHGHLAVFEIIGDVIRVLKFYHTAQDWQNKLSDDLD